MRVVVCLAVMGALAMLAGSAPADEEKVPLDKLPKAVSEAVKKRFPKAELVEASKETEDGKTQYEVSVKEAGKKIDVTLTADGKIVTMEKQIAEKDLPKKVADAVKAKYANAKYEIVEEVIKVKDGKETLEYYEVLITTADKKKFELEISPGGEIKKTEDKTGKDN